MLEFPPVNYTVILGRFIKLIVKISNDVFLSCPGIVPAHLVENGLDCSLVDPERLSFRKNVRLLLFVDITIRTAGSFDQLAECFNLLGTLPLLPFLERTGTVRKNEVQSTKS